MPSTTDVILVNENDVEVGTMEKMEAHKKGLLHRAFSIFIFNKKGEMLLQQRADHKYHSPGLWTNACCSHPMPDEQNIEAAHRRLVEEMGFNTTLDFAFTFTYKTIFENGLTEHEVDHVFTGEYEGDINPDRTEVKDYCFMKMEAIQETLQLHPNKYTSWFRIAFPKVQEHLSKTGIHNSVAI